MDNVEGGPSVLYIDRHFIHEVTSPQAFAGIRVCRHAAGCAAAHYWGGNRPLKGRVG